MRVYVVKYCDEGKEIEKGFNDRVEAEKLKKLKKGKIRALDVQLKVTIRV